MHTESDNIKQSGQHLIDAINDKGPESLLAIEAFYRLQGVIMGLNNSDLQIFICAETDRLTSKLADVYTKHDTKNKDLPYPYDIYAHRDNVRDLPLPFMTALRKAMLDKSYGNDMAASFGIIHPDHDKIFHLWIEGVEGERENEESARFYFSLLPIAPDSPYEDGSDTYLGICDYSEIECLMATESLDELATSLCEHLPAFKAAYKNANQTPESSTLIKV